LSDRKAQQTALNGTVRLQLPLDEVHVKHGQNMVDSNSGYFILRSNEGFSGHPKYCDRNIPNWSSSANAKKLETNPINNAAQRMIVGNNKARPCMNPKITQYRPAVQTQTIP
jgi:hypothetical protein